MDGVVVAPVPERLKDEQGRESSQPTKVRSRKPAAGTTRAREIQTETSRQR
jgi:hypothetical protein